MADAYRWIVDSSESYLAVAACVTMVRGVDLAGTLEAFGGDPSAPPESIQSFVNGEHYGDAAAVGVVGDLVLVVEPNGFQGTRAEVLRRASRGGMAVSVFWNVNGVNAFRYVLDGQVVTRFDMMFPDRPEGSDPYRLLARMADLPFDVGMGAIAAGFALAERVTGQALTKADILGIGDVWPLIPVLDDLYRTPVEYHPLRHQHAELVDLVGAAPPEVQREVAAMAAERAAAATGLDGEPGVRASLERLRSAPGQPLAPQVAELVRHILHRSSQASTGMYRPGADIGTAIAAAQAAHRYANAANALYRATNPDALTAALDALQSASMAIGDGVLDTARRLCEPTA